MDPVEIGLVKVANVRVDVDIEIHQDIHGGINGIDVDDGAKVVL